MLAVTAYPIWLFVLAQIRQENRYRLFPDLHYSGMTFHGIAAPIRNVATEFLKTPNRSLRRLRFDFFKEIGLGVMVPVRMAAVPSSLIVTLETCCSAMRAAMAACPDAPAVLNPLVLALDG